jgi:hypothetical protein
MEGFIARGAQSSAADRRVADRDLSPDGRQPVQYMVASSDSASLVTNQAARAATSTGAVFPRA